MERALDVSALAEALGGHEDLPTAEQLQQLIADLEVALIIRRPAVPPDVLKAAWYLHGVASSDAAYQLYSQVRQRRAFAVSAHIFDLALLHPSWGRAERLEIGFGAAIGYRRAELEPNATAIYRRLDDLIVIAPPVLEHARTLAVEAGLAFVGLQTRRLFSTFSLWRRQLNELARQIDLPNLTSTAFGTAEMVVLAVEDLLYYLAFGEIARLEQARSRLQSAVRGEAGPEDLDGRWVASHLLNLTGEMAAGAIWSMLPPTMPRSAKQAFTLASPPVLTLWQPQRELLNAHPSALTGEVRRLVVSVPTSGGKTLLGQLIMVAHLAIAGSSVCYVTPTRSLGREVRRAMAGRLRILQKEVGFDEPDYGMLAISGGLAQVGTWADLIASALAILGAEPPDVEVMTPERLGHLLHRDASAALNRFGMFVFDEAQLIGEAGRGFTVESLLAFLHWRTRETRHRIVLLSASLGNAGQVMGWLDPESHGVLHTSDWRGPRRLHAVFTTEPNWNAETRVRTRSPNYPGRAIYPLRGIIRLKPAENAAVRHLSLTRPVGQLARRVDQSGTVGSRDQAHSTPDYKAAAKMVAALGHAGAVLVVTSTRDAARRMAVELAAGLPERSDSGPLVDLARLQLGQDHPLVATLRHGVAFHHAALPADILEMLEEGLREERLGYLTCTSTLTEGVNLPVRTVVIAETRYAGQPAAAQLSGPRLVNALGRAGRAGRETEGWMVLVHHDRPRPTDFDLLRPSQPDLVVHSQLTSDEALEALSVFEETLRTAEDAVFRVAGRIGDFISFVWFVLAAEEQLGRTPLEADINGALQSTLAFQQLDPPQRARWAQVAESVRSTYDHTDTDQRRAWARAGTTVGSSREIDRLASAVVDRVKADNLSALNYASADGAIELFGALRIFEMLLALPERPADWRFRTSRSGQSTSLDIDPRSLLQGWLAGVDLATLANRHLSQVADPAWRIEQLVDAVTAHFQHFLAWTVSVLVETANERLSNSDTDARVCPQLGPFIRYGVNSGQALGLMVAGVRSRRLAHAIAAAATSEGSIDDVRQWLGRMSLPEWRERFGATATEILDLLDLTRTRRRSALRTLLEAGIVEVRLDRDALVEERPSVGPDIGELAAGVPVAVAELLQDPEPRRLGLFDNQNVLLAVVPTSSHNDLKAVIDTGLATEALLARREDRPILRLTLAEATGGSA